MLQLLLTRKVGVCLTLIAAYTFLVMVMVRRLECIEPAKQTPPPISNYETANQTPHPISNYETTKQTPHPNGNYETAKQTPHPNGNYETAKQTPHPNNNSYITDCITRRILGRIPDDMVTELFDAQQIGESDETREQRQESFQKVFEKREWGDQYDKAYQGIQSSGPGSTLRYSQEVIAGLHQIIGDFKLQMGVSRVRLLDIPCGDMAWMSRFLKTRDDVDYTGMDIVPELIGNHTESFKKYPWKFLLRDIVEKPLNESYDIILSRMMFQHLYTRDVLKVLKKFSDSGSRYLLTTTFYTVEENTDFSKKLSEGRFRLLNLEIPPVSLAPPKCMFRDGEDAIPFLGLWKLPLRKIRDCNKQTTFTLPGRNIAIYSCSHWTYSQP